MRFDYLKDRKELLSPVLFGISAFLAIMILVKVGGFFVAPARAEQLVKEALAQSKLEEKDMEKYFAESRAIADELKKKNLFAPPPPKQHPVKQVQGILGDEVLIKGKWYKVGDSVADAKILAIEPTQVRIEWDGKEKVFTPISAASAAEPKRQEPVVERKMEVRKTAAPVVEPVEKVVAAPVEEDPLAWLGVELSPEMRKKFLEYWNNIPDEHKEKAKEEWNKMSDEQKQQAIKAWEEHM